MFSCWPNLLSLCVYYYLIFFFLPWVGFWYWSLWTDKVWVRWMDLWLFSLWHSLILLTLLYLAVQGWKKVKTIINLFILVRVLVKTEHIKVLSDTSNLNASILQQPHSNLGWQNATYLSLIQVSNPWARGMQS